MRMSLRVLTGLAAAIALSSPAVIAAPAPLELNVIVSQTGSGSFAGQAEAAALQALETLTNKTGGIKGQPVHFAFHDDQSSPQVAVQIANDLLTKKVSVIIGPTLAATCSAIAPLLKDGPFAYCMSPVIVPLPTPGAFQFAINPTSENFIAVLMRYLRSQKSIHRIATLTTTDASGQDGDRSLDAAINLPDNHSLQIIDREHFNPTDISVSAQMSRVKAANADALIVWCAGSPALTALRGIQDVGLTIPVALSPANASYIQMKAMASMVPKTLLFPSVGVLAQNAVTNQQQRKAIQDFTLALAPARPDLLGVTAWDPGVIIIQALRQLGPAATADQIRAWLVGKRSVIATNGSYDFVSIPQRGVDEHNAYVSTWNSDAGTWNAVGGPGGVPLTR